MSGRQLQTGWNRANMCPCCWIKTSVCLSGPVSQLLLMRPRCHTDHTYCRLLLNLFPRPLEHTHTHTLVQTDTQPGSIFTQSSRCNSPAFSNSSYTLWRFAVLSISHELKNPETKRLRFVGTVAGGNSLRSPKTSLTCDSELKRETEPWAATVILALSRTLCRSLTYRHDSRKCQLETRNNEIRKRARSLLLLHNPTGFNGFYYGSFSSKRPTFVTLTMYQ